MNFRRLVRFSRAFYAIFWLLRTTRKSNFFIRYVGLIVLIVEFTKGLLFRELLKTLQTSSYQKTLFL